MSLTLVKGVELTILKSEALPNHRKDITHVATSLFYFHILILPMGLEGTISRGEKEILIISLVSKTEENTEIIYVPFY